jgi:methylenetetrahydrofolate reductase (NADPH)
VSLQNAFQADKLIISFELFPPKTEKGEKNLYRHVGELMKFNPDFITCTYGAGGSTRDKTMEIIQKVKADFDIPVASHLTLVGSTADQLRDYLNRAKSAGIEYIVALRGDPPQGSENFEQTEGGFRYANELVELIHGEFSNFGVLVAGYPETHREAPSADADLENLKRKVDAGADAVVTQLFYDNADFFRFKERCDAAGINVPIVPGILPVTSLKQIERIASLCGAGLPSEFTERLAEKVDKQWQFDVGVEFAINQTRELIDSGVPGIHYYVLNQSPATTRILNAVDVQSLRP